MMMLSILKVFMHDTTSNAASHDLCLTASHDFHAGNIAHKKHQRKAALEHHWKDTDAVLLTTHVAANLQGVALVVPSLYNPTTFLVL